VTRLVLLAPPHTRSQRQGVFGGDAEPGESVVAKDTLMDALGNFRPDVVLAAPSRICRATASSLGIDVTVIPDLADCDYGRWTGRRFEDVLAEAPGVVRAWLDDPATAPHGGETIAALVDRVGGWLDEGVDGGSVLAVAPGAVIRAAVLRVLRAPVTSYSRVDVAPLGCVRLNGHAGRWNLVAH
jgi:broad specificity phosphatase PhoE